MVFENIITKEEANYILEKSQNQFVEDISIVSGVPENSGKSSTFFLSKKHAVIEKMLRRICEKVGADFEKVEDLEVVKYEPNGIHGRHYDRRYRTVTIFLNDDFEGGEIYFPYLREKFRPSECGGISFQTENNKFSLHENIPVTKGIKYVVYIWIN